MWGRREWRALAWGMCFSVPIAIVLIAIDAGWWALPVVFLTGYAPSALKMTEDH
jgi:hypothetical protein